MSATIAVFSTKKYDVDHFEKYNDENYELIFVEEELSIQSFDSHSQGSHSQIDAVCVFVNDTVDSKMLDHLKEKGVKGVLSRCAGFDRVDAKYAHGIGIFCCRVPAYSPYAVAEQTVSLLLALNRKLHIANNRTSIGNFSNEGLVGMDLRGKTVGVIGTGKIGGIFMDIMLGFGCKIAAFDIRNGFAAKPTVTSGAMKQNKSFTPCSLTTNLKPVCEKTQRAIEEIKAKAAVALANTSELKYPFTPESTTCPIPPEMMAPAPPAPARPAPKPPAPGPPVTSATVPTPMGLEPITQTIDEMINHGEACAPRKKGTPFPDAVPEEGGTLPKAPSIPAADKSEDVESIADMIRSGEACAAPSANKKLLSVVPPSDQNRRESAVAPEFILTSEDACMKVKGTFGQQAEIMKSTSQVFSQPKPAARAKKVWGPNVEFVTLEELYERSDIISLHCPLLPVTEHMINKKTISKMKRGVYILNCARGSLINSEDVMEGIADGQIGGFGLDVYEKEAGIFFNDCQRRPSITEDDVLMRLMACQQVLISAHQGFLTHEALTAIAKTTFLNMTQILEGKTDRELTNWISPNMG